MKFSWLLPAMLGGGVPANLDKAGIAVSNKVSGYECRVLLGKGIAHHQDNSASQHGRDAISIQSPSANTVTVNIDTLHIAIPPKNQTKHTQYVQRDATPDDPAPIITFKPTNDNAAPDTEQQQPSPSTRQAEPPNPDYDADPDEASASAPEGKETRNPASANQAIAGMSVGLVSVMLIFTVFL